MLFRFYTLLVWVGIVSVMTPSIEARERVSLKLHYGLAAPVVDGILDDAVWQEVEFSDQFTQQSPRHLVAPSEPTAIAVVYYRKSLYLAVKVGEQDVSSISTRLMRYDGDGDYDKIEIILSPRNDGENGYGFAVNPSGVRQDGMWIGDTTYDGNWDTQWEAKTRRTKTGWTVEMAIPLAGLRYVPGKSIWGIQVKRWMAKRHELAVLAPRPKGTAGEISHMGQLTGTSKITSALPFSQRPELFMRYIQRSDNMDSSTRPGLTAGAGGYIKAGLSPEWTVDLAINPDFGEVEVDPAAINLTNVETFYGEKRPFFLENAALFKTPLQLFYSRRLGEAPGDPGLNDNEELRYKPVSTQIVGASKLSGESSRGVYLGFVHALSKPTLWRIQNTLTGEQRTRTAAPWTHDIVLRTGKRFRHGDNLGLMATAHMPEELVGDAHAAAVDWQLYSDGKTYVFSGQLAGSSVKESGVYEQGAAVKVSLAKQSGANFVTSLDYDLRTADFDINKLGYIDRSDLHNLMYQAQWRQMEARGNLYELYTGLKGHFQWNMEGMSLKRAMVLYLSAKWRNQMWTHVGGYGDLPYWDDMEVLEGPAVRRPTGAGVWAGFSTSYERTVGFQINNSLGTNDSGYYSVLNPVLFLRLNRFEAELGFRYTHSEKRLSFVETVTDDNAEDSHFVAKRNMDELDTSFKGTFVFLANLTLQLNAQLLVNAANYYSYRQIVEGSHYLKGGRDDDADFATSVLQLQALLRYAFKPQSVLYVSYTRKGLGEANRQFSMQHAYRLSDTVAEQRFMVKVSYVF